MLLSWTFERFVNKVLPCSISPKLKSSSLYFKQGPALYAYNNARFTKADWRGIRLVCDSIKVEDPMKVGRFGLGFKSVFHMTGTATFFPQKEKNLFICLSIRQCPLKIITVKYRLEGILL